MFDAASVLWWRNAPALDAKLSERFSSRELSPKMVMIGLVPAHNGPRLWQVWHLTVTEHGHLQAGDAFSCLVLGTVAVFKTEEAEEGLGNPKNTCRYASHTATVNNLVSLDH